MQARESGGSHEVTDHTTMLILPGPIQETWQTLPQITRIQCNHGDLGIEFIDRDLA